MQWLIGSLMELPLLLVLPLNVGLMESLALFICLFVCLFVYLFFCQRDKTKNNAQIFTKLSTQVETLKISDEFEDGQNPSSHSNFITGYLLILDRFSIEIYIKMLKYQLFRHHIRYF